MCGGVCLGRCSSVRVYLREGVALAASHFRPDLALQREKISVLDVLRWTEHWPSRVYDGRRL